MSVNAFLLLMAMVATTVIARNEEILENFKKVHARLPVYENQCDPPFKAVEGGYCYFLAFDQMSTSWRGAQLVCSWLHPDSRLAEFETLNELVDATLFLTMEKSNPWTQLEWIDANNETSLPFLCEIEANPPPIAWRCPEGFFRLANSCYAYGDTEQLNWWDAQSYCGSLTAGGRLAEIETVEELSLLTAHLAENPTANCDRGYFIGAEDVGSNNHYKWASSGTPVAFYSWFPGQPNNDGADDAIAIWCNYNFEWIDANNETSLPFLCEIEANPPPIAWRCPEGFFRLANSCYAYGDTEQLNWWDAQSYCGSLTAGGRLAEIETVEELSLLTAHLAENPTANCDRGYFIGAEDVGSNNHYKWASSGTPVAFYSWFPGQPNNDGADDAIAIRSEGTSDREAVTSGTTEATWNTELPTYFLRGRLRRRRWLVDAEEEDTHEETVMKKEEPRVHPMLKNRIKLLPRAVLVVACISLAEFLPAISLPSGFHNANFLPGKRCPNEFHRFGNTCYYLSTLKAPWDTAQEICKLLAPEGKLVEMNEEMTMYLVTGYISGRFEGTSSTIAPIWTGGIRNADSAEFQWAAEEKEVKFMNWGETGPKNETDEIQGILIDCENGCTWATDDITKSYTFMCQSPMILVSTSDNGSVVIVQSPPTPPSACSPKKSEKIETLQSKKIEVLKDCPFPFVKLGKSCYLFQNKFHFRNWDAAQEYCANIVPGGKLAEFETVLEQFTVTQHLIGMGCQEWAHNPWVGAFRSIPGEGFIWKNSETAVDAHAWYKGHPTSSRVQNTDAMALYCNGNFHFLTYPRTTTTSFICELDVNPAVETWTELL
ncbi:unnamed protein product [Cyprideis torosa]|uniref:Uncharacterized protein n=1 Tax=Cyprideis torosa TaxID=163714 RepID=A0A7R8WEB1_9CRUS|nr:unnamed protein product [Cyprideis torosa]CAG0895499.1 unnamed protein product [Cyprideis torosa]